MTRSILIASLLALTAGCGSQQRTLVDSSDGDDGEEDDDEC